MSSQIHNSMKIVRIPFPNKAHLLVLFIFTTNNLPPHESR